MSLSELTTKWELDYPAITKARDAAATTVGELEKLLANELSEDVNLVVFGSLARDEWTGGSDLDWTLLIDGQADHEHAYTASRVGSRLKENGRKEPGQTGTFGRLTFSHNIIHQIGGADDSNRNTTQRLLLLLESRAIGRSEAYHRVVRGVLRRYLQNDFRAFRQKVPRFLLNDLHRYWRTMCVDYASKYRERAGDGWAIRNVKLRMSRKLIFAAGLVACYSCDPTAGADCEPGDEGLAGYLERFVSSTPLDILCGALLRWSGADTAGPILTAYNAFLAALDDVGQRGRLEKLAPHQAESDELFKELQSHTRSFEDGLCRLFFDAPVLCDLNRKYGVF